MKTGKFTLVILLIFNQTMTVFSQTDTRIKALFLELPLDSSRKSLCTKLQTDKRFIERKNGTDSNSIFNDSATTFLGLSDDKGIIKSNPDSIIIELTFGTATYRPNFRFKDRVKSQTVLSTYYYFNSLDSVNKEYSNCVNIIRPTAKGSFCSGIGSNYGLSAEGITFKLKGRTKSEIEILAVKLPENKYALYLIYRRNEN